MMKRKRKKWSIPKKKKIKLEELENTVYDIGDDTNNPRTESSPPSTDERLPIFSGSSSPESRDDETSDRRNIRSVSPPVSRRRMFPQRKYSAPIFTTRSSKSSKSSRSSNRNRMRMIGEESAPVKPERTNGSRKERVKEKKKRTTVQRNKPNFEMRRTTSSRMRKKIQRPVILTRIPKKEDKRSVTQNEMKKILSSRNRSFKKNDFTDPQLIRLFQRLDSRERDNNREILRIKLCNIHGRKIIEHMNDFKDRKIKSTLTRLVLVVQTIVILYSSVSRNESKFLNDTLIKGIDFEREKSVNEVKSGYKSLYKIIKEWFIQYLLRKIPEDIDESYYFDDTFRQSIGLVEDWVVNVLDQKEVEDGRLLQLKDRIEKISIKLSRKKF